MGRINCATDQIRKMDLSQVVTIGFYFAFFVCTDVLGKILTIDNLRREIFDD